MIWVSDWLMLRQMAAVRQMELRLVNWKISIPFKRNVVVEVLNILIIWNVKWLKIYEKML
jgi:hypothetical protein